MVNNTANKAIVILINGSLLVYFVFSGSRTKQVWYSSLHLELFLEVVHFRDSPFGESGDQISVHHLIFVCWF